MNSPRYVEPTPMHSPDHRMLFCDRYFAAVGARTVYEADNYREYELPREVDKELTDRPYFWMWVEQTGQQVRPTVLRLAFDESAEQRENHRVREQALAEASPYLTDIQRQYFVAPKTELLTVGSFRLDKLYDSCSKRGRFASVAPLHYKGNDGLVPWLMVNAVVSYRCDTAEQSLLSVGICLENGQIVEGFYHMIETIDMTPMQPTAVRQRMRLSTEDGFERFRAHVFTKMRSLEHRWAWDADERLARELDQIHTYYNSLQHDLLEADWRVAVAERDMKIKQAISRGAPKIEVDVKQAALVGLIDKRQL